MEDICIKVDIPAEYKEEFTQALAKAIKSFSEECEYAMVESIAVKSKLTEEQSIELGDKVKEGMWKRYKKAGW